MSNIYKKLSVGNLMAMAVILPMVANTTNTASSPLLPSAPDAQKAAQAVKAGDVQILRINPTLVEIVFANQQRVAVDFYGESVTKAQVIFDKATQLFRIINLEHGKTVA